MSECLPIGYNYLRADKKPIYQPFIISNKSLLLHNYREGIVW